MLHCEEDRWTHQLQQQERCSRSEWKGNAGWTGGFSRRRCQERRRVIITEDCSGQSAASQGTNAHLKLLAL